MIRVSILDDAFNRAYWNAKRTFPVHELELPRQFGQRWRETFKCRVEYHNGVDSVHYIFDNDEDYTYFMLKWS